MPYVPKYTPQELATIMQAMQEYPPQKVEQDYRTGEITLKEKLLRLSLYGDAQREAQIRSDIQQTDVKDKTIKNLGGGAIGELKYFAQGVMKEFKGAWDAADQGKPSEAIFHGIMGGLKLLGAYDVPGDVAERWSLELFPDSPGFARAVNWATWIPTNLFGISALLKAPFMAAGKTLRAGAKATAAAGELATYLKDPVGYVVKAAKTQDAMMATKVAKAQAENTVRKGAGVAGAAADAEAKGGTQVFKTAEPAPLTGPTQAGASAVQFASPQDLEKLTVTELIKHYEERAVGMVRSKSAGGPGVSHAETRAAASAKPSALRSARL